ncbi:MAG: hypothetical protein ACPGR8_06250 [Limisphaerales bacterium]
MADHTLNAVQAAVDAMRRASAPQNMIVVPIAEVDRVLAFCENVPGLTATELPPTHAQIGLELDDGQI